jgi:hypothetical protein
MQTIAGELGSFINQHKAALGAVPEEKMAFKSSLLKWSRKEIIGHLIDSAQNNIRRFIIAQYEESPFIVYDQDKWVAIANYQHWNTQEIIDLWYLLNKQIVEIWKNTSVEMAQRTCQTQELHSIEWLANDYLKHLRHHIHQVLELEAVPYP